MMLHTPAAGQNCGAPKTIHCRRLQNLWVDSDGVECNEKEEAERESWTSAMTNIQ